MEWYKSLMPEQRFDVCFWAYVILMVALLAIVLVVAG